MISDPKFRCVPKINVDATGQTAHTNFTVSCVQTTHSTRFNSWTNALEHFTNNDFPLAYAKEAFRWKTECPSAVLKGYIHVPAQSGSRREF